MRTIKDPKKFGKGKPVKNRNSRKGYFLLKEIRKQNRKLISYIKDCLVHHRELPEGTSIWNINKALKQL